MIPFDILVGTLGASAVVDVPLKSVARVGSSLTTRIFSFSKCLEFRLLFWITVFLLKMIYQNQLPNSRTNETLDLLLRERKNV